MGLRFWLACSATAGCSTPPDFTALDVDHYNDGSEVRIGDIVDHIKCEIYSTALAYPELRQADYYVTVLFNLQVNDSGGLAPSFNIIHPIALAQSAQTASQSLTYALIRYIRGMKGLPVSVPSTIPVLLFQWFGMAWYRALLASIPVMGAPYWHYCRQVGDG